MRLECPLILGQISLVVGDHTWDAVTVLIHQTEGGQHFYLIEKIEKQYLCQKQ